MASISVVRLKFDDTHASIGAEAGGFFLRDRDGNEVAISKNAMLRCLAIAEHEKMVPALPDSFWNHDSVKSAKD